MHPREPPTDANLLALAEQLSRRLLAAQRRLATAESCTGGWLSKAVTDVAGSSGWFECGFVTYSNDAKTRDLGVLPRTLERHGAVSEATVREMAEGALQVSGADIAVAVSGIAGPDGGSPDKEVGTVWFGVAWREGEAIQCQSEVERFEGDREAVRRHSVGRALKLIMQLEWSTQS